MSNPKCQKWLCCTKNLTLATRLIAFIGIVLKKAVVALGLIITFQICSALLTTVLINDISRKKFQISREVASFFGIDWRHLHSKIDHSPHADPEGKIITALLIVYSLVFFLTNVSLLLGSILEKKSLAVLWLISECVGSLSKLTALIFHFVTERNDLNPTFISGSLIYLLAMLWWWLVVYHAQSTWHKEKRPSIQLSTRTELDSVFLDSPDLGPYDSPYTVI